MYQKLLDYVRIGQFCNNYYLLLYHFFVFFVCACLFLFWVEKGGRGKVVNKDLWPWALHPLCVCVSFCVFAFILGREGGPEARLSTKTLHPTSDLHPPLPPQHLPTSALTHTRRRQVIGSDAVFLMTVLLIDRVAVRGYPV